MSRERALRPLRRRGRAVSALGRGQARARSCHRAAGVARGRVVRVHGWLRLRLRAGVRQQHNGRGAATAAVEGARRCRCRRRREDSERRREPRCHRRERHRPVDDGSRSATTTGGRAGTRRGRRGRGRFRIERTLCLGTRRRSLRRRFRRRQWHKPEGLVFTTGRRGLQWLLC